MKDRRKRLNFSVKRRMQIRLFIKVLGIAVVGVGIMAAVFYLYSDREINSSYRQFHIHADNFLELLQPAVITSLLLALVGSVVITLFLPIRIAGPAYRIERDLKERVAAGDLTVRFKLRKGDELGDLADALNTCLEHIGQTIRTAKQTADTFSSAADVTSGPVDSTAKDLAAKINDILGKLKV